MSRGKTCGSVDFSKFVVDDDDADEDEDECKEPDEPANNPQGEVKDGGCPTDVTASLQGRTKPVVFGITFHHGVAQTHLPTKGLGRRLQIHLVRAGCHAMPCHGHQIVQIFY